MTTKKSYGAKADASMHLWVEIARAFMSVRAKEAAYIESCGLTVAQFGVLEALYHTGAHTTGELTRMILSTPGNMTVVIKNLSEKGYIDSETLKDRRSRLISITESGNALMEQIFPANAKNFEEYFSCFGSDEMAEIANAMKKLEKHNRRQS